MAQMGLVKTLNRLLGERGLSEKQLDETFKLWWPKLSSSLAAIPKPSKQVPERESRELLEEILERQRSIELMIKRSNASDLLEQRTRTLMDAVKKHWSEGIGREDIVRM